MQLQYYRVTAPTDGIVGDIPVRVGDRVTTSTVLTTIDRTPGSRCTSTCRSSARRTLQARAAASGSSTTGRGRWRDTRIDFVSPQVDDQTQSVLVKAPVPSTKGFRTEQFVRAPVVWSTRARPDGARRWR